MCGCVSVRPLGPAAVSISIFNMNMNRKTKSKGVVPTSTLTGNTSVKCSTWSWRPTNSNRRKMVLVGMSGSGSGSGSGSSSESNDSIGMSVESAFKLLGVSEGASFDDILRAKNSILSQTNTKHDPHVAAKVEAAYDMLLMQSLTQRRAGKVVNNSIRYADMKPLNTSLGTMPQWLQSTIKGSPVIVEKPPASNLGIQAGIYGAMMVLTYINGTSSSAAGLAAADVPGVILATSFGASLYFMTKKNVKLGKATVITVGGLVVGAIVGSAVENWLHVDIVPFLGLHSPAAVVSEFIILSQFLVSLYLK